jgi:serine/threonine protein phosphatase 1
MYNGGEWCLSEDTEELKVLAKDADNMLPLVIVIGKGTDNRINIVHAEMYKDKNDELATDEDIDDWYFHDYQEENMIWGRTILQNKIIYKSRDINNKALSTTYVGHTPTDIPQEVISHRFIDTAACYFHRNGYEKAKLTMVRLNDSQVFSYNMKTQVIDEFKFK